MYGKKYKEVQTPAALVAFRTNFSTTFMERLNNIFETAQKLTANIKQQTAL